MIGLVGGIGAGKSVAAAIFGELGCVVVDSDKIGHEVLRRPEVVAQIRQWWGDGVMGEDGLPDRKKIAAIVFGDPAERRRLESLTHPLIDAGRRDIIQAGIENPAIRAFILDSPLLFESRLDRLCSSIVFIDADESQRLKRVEETRGWTAEELARREASQLPLSEKRSRSQFVIRNDGSPGELRQRLAESLTRILETGPNIGPSDR